MVIVLPPPQGRSFKVGEIAMERISNGANGVPQFVCGSLCPAKTGQVQRPASKGMYDVYECTMWISVMVRYRIVVGIKFKVFKV